MSQVNGRHKAGDDALTAGVQLRIAGPAEEEAMRALAEGVLWDRPLPLDDKPAPSLDLTQWPPVVASKLEAVSRKMGVAPDLPASAFLGEAGTIIQGEWEAEIDPDHIEPLSLWSLACGKAGEGKSPAGRSMASHRFRWESEIEAECVSTIDRARAQRKVLEVREDQARKRLEKNPSDPDALHDFQEASAALAAHAVPEAPVLTFEDITTEAMGQQLVGQHGRGAVISEEADLIDTIAGRYNQGRANPRLWLAGKDGDGHRLHRAKRSAELIKRVLITLSLMVQPGAWAKLLQEDLLIHKGFFYRFLFFFPDSRLGRRVHTDYRIPATVNQEYNDLMMGLLRLYRGSGLLPPPHRRLVLSDESRQFYIKMKRELEPLMAEGARLEPISGWVSKLPGNMVRLAGVFFVCEKMPSPAGSAELPVQYLERVWRLALTYFIPHAERAFGIIPEDADAVNARRLLSRLTARDDTKFTRSLVNRIAGLEADALEAALELLVSKNWLRAVEDRATGGRPKTLYLLHPDAKRNLAASGAREAAQVRKATMSSCKPPASTEDWEDRQAQAAELEEGLLWV